MLRGMETNAVGRGAGIVLLILFVLFVAFMVWSALKNRTESQEEYKTRCCEEVHWVVS